MQDEEIVELFLHRDEAAIHACQEAYGSRLQNEEKRLIFLRRYWYLDSVSQIAQRYGIQEGKVKMKLFRLRNSLREYLKKEG